MRGLLTVVLMALAGQAWATPYFQHASLSPSNIQGELFTGPMRTNAGISQVTMLPLFYRNASPTDPWYKPSFSPLVIGGTSGGGSAAAVAGAVVDVGPQIVQGIEGGIGLFSPSAKQSVVNFFNCSASATACGALSAGVLANINIEDGGKFSTNGHQLWLHPIGYYLGPTIRFGGAVKP